MSNVLPVILAGGSGQRLWPVSRESYPKQFCKLFDDLSLLQKTVLRAANFCNSGKILISTNERYYFLCKNQIDEIGIRNVTYILEPCARNTAPAIAIAAMYAEQHVNPDSTLFIMPSDQYLEEKSEFFDILDTAHNLAQQNKLIAFGITPTAPKTGYGYIAQGQLIENNCYSIKQFVEKPNHEKAIEYLFEGNYFWNSGMFAFKASTYLDELCTHAKDIFSSVKSSYQNSEINQDYFHVNSIIENCRSASIDYEVMEKTQNSVMIPLDLGWNDLGCWSSVAETGKKDEHGNICQGPVTAYKTENCLISSEELRVIAIGIKNQVIVTTPDAVLIIDKQYSQDVKTVVAQLKSQNDSVATQHNKVYRPWGYYELISSDEKYHVKRLYIAPGASLSLQLHNHRSEHWVVVAGVAHVIKGDQSFTLQENQSIYIEKQQKHRLSNPGNEPLLVIEVQSGDYLGEDDIIRFADEYNRKVEKA